VPGTQPAQIISSYPLGGSYYEQAVDCPTTTQCTSVDRGGDEVTFNPQSPSAANQHSLEMTQGGGLGLVGVSCGAGDTTQCVAVDGSTGREITFNPGTGQATSSFIDGYGDITAISCQPGGQQCTTVDGRGVEVTFNPTSPGGHYYSPIDGNGATTSVSCVSSTQCTSIDIWGTEVTFNPYNISGHTWAQVDKPSNGSYDSGVSCVATSWNNLCTAVDTGGTEATFAPQDPSAATSRHIDASSLEASAVSCATFGAAMQCVAVDGNGYEISGTYVPS
jgi:hypothetical protein